MASYFPEGECFFVRSSLRYGSGNWTAENTRQFYSHVLLEYSWNGWVAKNQTSRYHKRSQWKTGKGALWNTLFGDWDRFYLGESKDKSPANMLSIMSHPNSLNWNETRDLDSGGPRKYILRPVEITNTNTQWLWIDATIPLRAIYFPLCQSTDQAYPNLCTYAVIDFKHRTQIDVADLLGRYEKITLSKEHGLGWRDNMTWGFNVPNIITYLSIPHKLRNPEQDLFRPKIAADALFVRSSSDITWNSAVPVKHAVGFFREIDLANVLSATFGVEVGWRPYQFSSAILNMLQQIVQLGLGFIPGAGALLSVAFGMGVELLKDPQQFKVDNVLNLTAAILTTLIESSSKSKKYIAPGFLPSRTQALFAQLTDEERAERRKVGDEINARLTSEVEQRVVITSLLEESVVIQRKDSTDDDTVVGDRVVSVE